MKTQVTVIVVFQVLKDIWFPRGIKVKVYIKVKVPTGLISMMVW